MEYGELGFGEVVRGTVGAAAAGWVPILVYIATFTAIGSTVDLIALESLDGVLGEPETLVRVQSFAGLGYGLAGLLIFLLSLIGQYLLWEAILRKSAFGRGLGRHRYLAFVGQSLLVSLGTSAGYILLIIPGLIMGARWSIAPALLLKSDIGVIEAMRRSWFAVRGNTAPVVWATLAGGLIIVLVGMVAGGTSIVAEQAIGVDPASAIAAQAIAHCSTVLGIALGVYLYGRIHGDSQELTEVFA